MIGSRFRGQGEMIEATANPAVPYKLQTRDEREKTLLNRKRADETVSICDPVAYDVATGWNVTTRDVGEASSPSVTTRVIEEEGSRVLLGMTMYPRLEINAIGCRRERNNRLVVAEAVIRSTVPQWGVNDIGGNSDTPSPCSRASAQTDDSMSGDAPSNVHSYVATPTFHDKVQSVESSHVRQVLPPMPMTQQGMRNKMWKNHVLGTWVVPITVTTS